MKKENVSFDVLTKPAELRSAKWSVLSHGSTIYIHNFYQSCLSKIRWDDEEKLWILNLLVQRQIHWLKTWRRISWEFLFWGKSSLKIKRVGKQNSIFDYLDSITCCCKEPTVMFGTSLKPVTIKTSIETSKNYMQTVVLERKMFQSREQRSLPLSAISDLMFPMYETFTEFLILNDALSSRDLI